MTHSLSSDSKSNEANEHGPTRRGSPRDPGEILAAQLVQADLADADLARRLRLACGGDNWAVAGMRLGLRSETVRRVCQSGRPTARFLARMCRTYGVDGHWLITGEGTPYLTGRDAASLKGVSSETLVAEVSERLGRMLAAADPPIEARAVATPPEMPIQMEPDEPLQDQDRQSGSQPP